MIKLRFTKIHWENPEKFDFLILGGKFTPFYPLNQPKSFIFGACALIFKYEVNCQLVADMQHTEYRLMIVFLSYFGDINAFIFNRVKLTHFIADSKK